MVVVQFEMREPDTEDDLVLHKKNPMELVDIFSFKEILLRSPQALHF